MVVLDVACGAGHVSEQIAPNVHQVVGIDLTRALLDAGAARLRDAGIANVLLQEGNATRLPFVDESFDLVVCRTALHHFADPERTVVEMRRVCRPSGRVVVADMVAPGPEVRERFDRVHRDLDPSHVRCLLHDELVDLMDERVGSVTRVETPSPLHVPINLILTDAANEERVRSALRAELEGGEATGFEPDEDGGDVGVSFRISVVEATRS
jgi:SAM-dependent methyltransferase